jgi:arylsulfatase A-like enzyme
MIFNRFYPSAANCAPSRACMLTGMYTPRHQIYTAAGKGKGDVSKMRWKVPTIRQDSTFNTFPVSMANVKPEFESLAEMLKKSGYISARFGKWHIGDDNQGFDVLSASGKPGEITNYNGKEKRYYDDIYVAERLTDLTLDFIDQNKNKPFFIYLSHWEVHTPLAARPGRIRYFQEKLNDSEKKDFHPVYAAEIEQVDLSVGRVLQKLKKLKLESNTVVIFTSDNGGLTSNDGGLTAVTSNFPLRAGKTTFYEGGIRVPLCIKWPGITKPGSKTDIPVTGVDFMPTLAEIASSELPQTQPVDGISVLPILKGEKFNKERSIFFHFPLYLRSGSIGVGVLPTFNGQENYWHAVPSTTIISGDWKLIYYYEYGRYELFNLNLDISEQNDLSSQKPEIATRLLNELNAWAKEVHAPIPTILNDKF